MKKCIPLIAFIVAPYLFFLLIILLPSLPIFYYCNGYQIIFISFLIITVLFYIPAIIYSFFFAKKAESKQLIFWAMIMKIVNIPIFAVMFIIGFFFFILPLGFVITIPVVIFDLFMLIPSSIYAVHGLSKAYEEGKISFNMSLLNVFLNFIFCTDVVSSVTIYFILKKKKLNT